MSDLRLITLGHAQSSEGYSVRLSRGFLTYAEGEKELEVEYECGPTVNNRFAVTVYVTAAFEHGWKKPVQNWIGDWDERARLTSRIREALELMGGIVETP